MFRKLLLLSVAGGALGAGITGCGAGSPAGGTAPAPAASNLAGNWLLAGALPESPFQPGAPGTQLSVTFSTVGNELVAVGQYTVACPSMQGSGFSTGIGGGFAATGTLAADGTFTVQSPATTTGGVSITSVSIAGTVPSAAGAAWSGSYGINTNGDGGCAVNQSAKMTAQAIAPFSGTFVASGTYTSGATKSAVTVTMVLTQGTTSTGAGGVPVDEAYLLNGTLNVTGIPCFHAGVGVSPNTPQPSGVAGSVFGAMAFPAFKMDDGSLVLVNVGANDLALTQLDALPLGISGGGCNTSSGQNQVQLGKFVRQN